MALKNGNGRRWQESHSLVGITLEICDSKIDRNHTPLCKSKPELAEQSTYAVVCFRY